MIYKQAFFLYLFSGITLFLFTPQSNIYNHVKVEFGNKKKQLFLIQTTKNINVSGIVKNLYSQAIGAEIMLIDKNNNIVATTKADSKTGHYNITASIVERAMYTLVYYNTSYFPEYEYINSSLPVLGEKNIINKTMAKLNVGETYTLAHYDFFSQSFFSYHEKAQLYRLAILMQKNPTMKIQATVYTDPSELARAEEVGWNRNKEWRSFSIWRADNFKIEITKLGIPISRIKIVPSQKAQSNMPKGAEKCNQAGRVDITILTK